MKVQLQILIKLDTESDFCWTLFGAKRRYRMREEEVSNYRLSFEAKETERSDAKNNVF